MSFNVSPKLLVIKNKETSFLPNKRKTSTTEVPNLSQISWSKIVAIAMVVGKAAGDAVYLTVGVLYKLVSPYLSQALGGGLIGITIGESHLNLKTAMYI